MRQCQLTTAVVICFQQSREEGGKDVDWVWLCGGCVSPPIQVMRLAVVWAVFYSSLVECVCSVAMLVMCVNCVMGGGQAIPH